MARFPNSHFWFLNPSSAEEMSDKGSLSVSNLRRQYEAKGLKRLAFLQRLTSSQASILRGSGSSIAVGKRNTFDGGSLIEDV
jgi:hypothetical protein